MILYASRYYLSHELREHEYLNASAFLTLRITQRKLCAPCENQQDRKPTNTQELSYSFSGLHLDPPLRLMYLVSKKCFCCDSQLRLSPLARRSQICQGCVSFLVSAEGQRIGPHSKQFLRSLPSICNTIKFLWKNLPIYSLIDKSSF